MLDEIKKSPLGYLAALLLPTLVTLWRDQPTGLAANVRYSP
jgi:hypothetical protein